MPINVSAFYDVVLHGRYRGQNIFNILHYRTGEDFIPGDFNLAGAPEVANAVKTAIWTNGIKSRMHEEYLLDKVVVYPRNPAFATIYSMPYTLEVGEYGVKYGATVGPSTCVIVRLNLENTSVFNGFFPPKRGYLAIGPIEEAAIDNDGNLEGADFAAWASSVECFADDLHTGLLGLETFYPIRVSTRKIAGVLTLRGWSDIVSTSVRHKTTFRRSRIGEA